MHKASLLCRLGEHPFALLGAWKWLHPWQISGQASFVSLSSLVSQLASCFLPACLLLSAATQSQTSLAVVCSVVLLKSVLKNWVYWVQQRDISLCGKGSALAAWAEQPVWPCCDESPAPFRVNHAPWKCPAWFSSFFAVLDQSAAKRCGRERGQMRPSSVKCPCQCHHSLAVEPWIAGVTHSIKQMFDLPPLALTRDWFPALHFPFALPKPYPERDTHTLQLSSEPYSCSCTFTEATSPFSSAFPQPQFSLSDCKYLSDLSASVNKQHQGVIPLNSLQQTPCSDPGCYWCQKLLLWTRFWLCKMLQMCNKQQSRFESCLLQYPYQRQSFNTAMWISPCPAMLMMSFCPNDSS